MKNYLEHETEVKFYDYLLSRETDWQWFIDTVIKRVGSDKTGHWEIIE